MTNKAYIVANKKQEFDVLKKFESKGLVWLSGDNPTEWVLSENSLFSLHASFPYALVERENNKISWLSIVQLTDEEIVYDGRKEEKMYKVTQEFMNELINWRDLRHLDARNGDWSATFRQQDFNSFPKIVSEWRLKEENSTERNNRLIAIIKWLNGEDVFEIEVPHKFVVRSKETHSDGYYSYVKVVDQMALHTDYNLAMKFDTREEAQEWANSHQVVVEIDEEGNEVE
jgi:hypothetical protein